MILFSSSFCCFLAFFLLLVLSLGTWECETKHNLEHWWRVAILTLWIGSKLIIYSFADLHIIVYLHIFTNANLHIYSFTYTIAQIITKPQEVHWFAIEHQLWGASHHICRNCPSDRLIICPNVRFDGNQSWRDSPKWGRLFEVEGHINHHHHHHHHEGHQNGQDVIININITATTSIITIRGEGWLRWGSISIISLVRRT